ncbi:TonB-dependent receptor plug [Leadbetterella byssophila DSM 17132]|uniref:TonB-dependent receptor plug n=1 Tax=Leadbetterella byssophila (strain DSM 17132 / JCM 16389 / KACC 11308 / NBRC 106382 / 4M15) TaxID=649349 RepID=E4RYE6_LEAB4|nr:outer membrane beta-barrel protein [Leadbetterella byssophila]ADQ18182.1 TonB-dependent receptor plug [Leadbetterella byssophila DSM 17132]
MKKLLLLMMLAINGQAQGIFVRGQLMESTSPIPYATVALLKGDSLYKATFSTESGEFEFLGVTKGNYRLKVSAVGYKTSESALTVDNNLELGIIRLQTESAQLNEVNIVALKPPITQEPDRLTYDLQADPDSKSMSVLEMMRKVPYLSLDGEDNLLMKDGKDFRIFINGKPSAMVERNYKEVLRSMPASSIQKIEVITTPPAKYDAEGISGIINIITTRRVDSGYLGNVSVSTQFPVGGPYLGGNINYKRGRLGITALGGGSLYFNPNYQQSFYRKSQESILQQNGKREADNKNVYMGTEWSYEIDSLNLLTAQWNWNTSRSSAETFQESERLHSGIREEYYQLSNLNQGKGQGMDAGFNYQHISRKDKNRLLTLSYLYNAYDSENGNGVEVKERYNYHEKDYRQVNNQYAKEHTAQVDVVYPIRSLMLEGGIKGIYRENKSRFGYQSTKGLYDSLDNNYFNRQQIYGMYTSFRYNGKKWGLSGGFRLENTILYVDFESSDMQVNRNYFNLLPTLTVNRKWGKNGLAFNYLQRIQRPGIYQLNPFVDRSNPSVERTGNPDLDPSVMQEIGVKYTYTGKTFFHIGASFIDIRDMLFPVISYNNETGITRHSYDNVGQARLLPALTLNMSRNWTKRWQMGLNARFASASVKGNATSGEIRNKGYMFGSNVNSTYRTSQNWRWSATLGYNGPSINVQETRNGFIYSHVTLAKEVVKNKLNLSATLNNPFTRYRSNRVEGFGTDFVQITEQRNYYRNATISLSYKFGQLKESIKKNQRSIRNDDVKNGD